LNVAIQFRVSYYYLLTNAAATSRALELFITVK